MFLHVRKVREFLESGIVSKIWWIDTLGMLADGLAKGAVPRELLLHAASRLDWLLHGDTPCGYRAPRRTQ